MTVVGIILMYFALPVGVAAVTALAIALYETRRTSRGRYRRTPSYRVRAGARLRAVAPARVRPALDARAAARARRALERAGAGVGIDVEHQAEPIMAWRAVEIAPDVDGRLKIWPLFHKAGSGALRLDDTAVCLGPFPRRHPAPWPDCWCGFYAVKDRRKAWVSFTGAVARVELFGTVIEHKDGYRASRQRIVALELTAHCPYEAVDVANALGVEVTKAKPAKEAS